MTGKLEDSVSSKLSFVQPELGSHLGSKLHRSPRYKSKTCACLSWVLPVTAGVTRGMTAFQVSFSSSVESSPPTSQNSCDNRRRVKGLCSHGAFTNTFRVLLSSRAVIWLKQGLDSHTGQLVPTPRSQIIWLNTSQRATTYTGYPKG